MNEDFISGNKETTHTHKTAENENIRKIKRILTTNSDFFSFQL